WTSRSFGAVMVLYYLAMLALSAYARSVTYAVQHPGTFLLAPLYALLHVTILVPIRLYALLTIRRVSWGTR
ncbi:MAG TPA: hyaluronan synthase, partial [Calditerricola sp.]